MEKFLTTHNQGAKLLYGQLKFFGVLGSFNSDHLCPGSCLLHKNLWQPGKERLSVKQKLTLGQT